MAISTEGDGEDMFQGKTVMITGASSGIGRAIAECLARRGARLILVARRRDRLESLAEALKPQIVPGTPITADLREDNAVDHIMRQTQASGHSVDVLVNNAGVGSHGTFVAADPDGMDGMMRLNMLALVRLTHRVLPDMVARRSGHILNVASTAAFQPTPYMGLYGATKSFVLSFSMSLWYELRRSGVGVTCLCPGPVDTEFFDHGGLDRQKAVFLKTAMSAESVAEAACRAMEKNRSTVIPGLINRIGAQGHRISPLRLLTRVTARLLRPVSPRT